MKILVVEDEPLILSVIEKQLQSEGYQVTAVTDGREALTQLEQTKFDIIITDILMPFTSGLELIGVVTSQFNRSIPIIVLSSLGQEATVMEAFQLGADDFITKPFNPNELSMRVKRLLKKSS
jgi:DNA-binding response OmpR family regulator